MSNKTTIQFPQTVNFLGELDALNRETAKRAFALFQQRGYMNGWDVDDWLRAESEILVAVPIEMSESDDSFTIRAEVPGFDAKNLSIRQTATRFTLAEKMRQERRKKGWRRQIYRIVRHGTVPPYCVAELHQSGENYRAFNQRGLGAHPAQGRATENGRSESGLIFAGSRLEMHGASLEPAPSKVST